MCIYIKILTMNANKYIFKLINEELGEFNFLNQEENEKHENTISILKKEEFQKQFIVDVALHPEKITTDIIEAKANVVGKEDKEQYTFDFSAKIKYQIEEKKKLPFQLVIKGEGSPNEIDVNYYSVELFSEFGDEINFKEYNKAPDKIKKIFLREFVGDLYDNIENNDNIVIR